MALIHAIYSFNQDASKTAALKGVLDLKAGEFEVGLLDLANNIIPELLSTLKLNKVANGEDIIICELN